MTLKLYYQQVRMSPVTCTCGIHVHVIHMSQNITHITLYMRCHMLHGIGHVTWNMSHTCNSCHMTVTCILHVITCHMITSAVSCLTHHIYVKCYMMYHFFMCLTCNIQHIIRHVTYPACATSHHMLHTLYIGIKIGYQPRTQIGFHK